MPTADNSNLPLRHSRLLKWFGKSMLNLLGWRFDGQLPNIPKQVVIVAPHTSNWDFIIGVIVLFALDLKASWIGKHTIFVPPFNIIMEWLGGIPVNRKLPNDLVNTTRGRFAEHEKMILGIAPEGTRSRVVKWKQGFYRIASGANIPIVCACLDYRKKTIGFGPAIMPSGNFEKDFELVRDFYSTVTARFPENFYLPGSD
jgi:1-acyl-sn-glycerol-3-phosphate acyltransferase